MAILIDDSLVWKVPEDAATNIVTLAAGSGGYVGLEPRIHDQVGIANLDAVAIMGPAVVTPNPADHKVREDGHAVLFKLPTLSTPGRYDVTVTVTTTEGQVYTSYGTLMVT